MGRPYPPMSGLMFSKSPRIMTYIPQYRPDRTAVKGIGRDVRLCPMMSRAGSIPALTGVAKMIIMILAYKMVY
jgi:hypothetical protein